jgi:hypothetical protein
LGLLIHKSRIPFQLSLPVWVMFLNDLFELEVAGSIGELNDQVKSYVLIQTINDCLYHYWYVVDFLMIRGDRKAPRRSFSRVEFRVVAGASGQMQENGVGSDIRASRKSLSADAL